MIDLILCAAFCATPAQAEALARVMPELTVEAAAQHLFEARLAGAMYDVDPAVLLAVAWHESRFEASAVTREPGHRVSCGVMTPVPKRRCEPAELTLEGGYVAGAAHLRVWLDVEHRQDLALVAYAGGGGSIRYPRAGWKAWRAMRVETRVAAKIRRAIKP